MKEGEIKPVRDKWKEIERVFKGKDTFNTGCIDQTNFMRILRLAGGLKGVNDTDFLRSLDVQGRGLRDSRGYIDYLEFSR
jgi:Ca2+-binding EF-hand superfamily protein